MRQWIAYAALAAAFFLVLVAPTRANEDEDHEYCVSVTNSFDRAAHARQHGYARKVQAPTAAHIEMMEHRIPFEFPKDSMFVIGWDGLSDEEKAVNEQHIFAGWDSADASIAAKGGDIDDETVDAMAMIYYQMCRAGAKTEPEPEKSGFKHTAAQPLNEQQASSIWALAYGQYHGPPEWLQMMPEMRVVSKAQLCGYLDKPADCRAEGRYFKGTVYLIDTLDFADVVDTTVLLHEFIHHFQTLKHGPVKSCEDWLDREHEAYRIQWEVLLKSDQYRAARDLRVTAGGLRCTEPKSQNSMGKAFRCEEEARFAAQLLRDEQYRIPAINLLADRDKQVLAWLRACSNEQQPIRDCVIRKCTATGME